MWYLIIIKAFILTVTKGPITWRFSARDEISARQTGMKFQPGVPINSI